MIMIIIINEKGCTLIHYTRHYKSVNTFLSSTAHCLELENDNSVVMTTTLAWVYPLTYLDQFFQEQVMILVKVDRSCRRGWCRSCAINASQCLFGIKDQ